MNKNFTIVVLDEVHEILYHIFEQQHCRIIDASKMSVDEAMASMHTAEIIIIRSRFKIDKAVIDACKHLKIIGRVGSGLENIDVQYAQSKNITCINSPEGNKDAVAEHILGMILMLLNSLKRADAEVRSGIWDRKNNWGHEIGGKTFAIIGYGNNGAALAKKLSGFECNILVYDKFKNNITDKHVKQVDMQTIFETADFVSLHVPLTSDTIYMADEKFFETFKKPIYFINAARGKCVNTKDLAAYINTGKIRGACIDVIEYEGVTFEEMKHTKNESFKFLCDSNKVILSPHIAGWTYESYYKMSKIIAEKIISVLPTI